MADLFVEHSYSCMVEKVSDYAIFLIDCAGVVQTWNPAAAVMKGYDKNEIVGRHFSVFYTDKDRREGHPEHNLQRAAEQGTFQEEGWRQRKDGSQFWALTEIIAITDGCGKLSGFCKLTRDISERQRMEVALRDADRHKDEFLAMLAHELRNPLASLSASATLLALGKPDADLAQKVSQVVGRQVKQMTGLVNDLLDVSRVSRGQITLDMASLDMKVVVGHAIEQVRPLIESREHTLAIKLAPSKAYVKGDEKRLIQIIANLLNNAAKYTPPGGNIGVQLSATASEVCIEVCDNGVGMEPEVQQVVFELFEQVQLTSDRTSGGLGIGLALVRSLTRLHGGTVSCYSDGVSHGSRFTVCLPRMVSDEPVLGQHSAQGSVELPAAGADLSDLIKLN